MELSTVTLIHLSILPDTMNQQASLSKSWRRRVRGREPPTAPTCLGCPHLPGVARPRKEMRRSVNFSLSRVSHSHTTSTRQPSLASAIRTRSSRRRLASNFAAQNSGRVVGMLALTQPRCLCQKQPWTNMTALRDGNTRSGVPGKDRRCRRNRYPSRWTKRLISSSGRVSVDLT